MYAINMQLEKAILYFAVEKVSPWFIVPTGLIKLLKWSSEVRSKAQTLSHRADDQVIPVAATQLFG